MLNCNKVCNSANVPYKKEMKIDGKVQRPALPSQPSSLPWHGAGAVSTDCSPSITRELCREQGWPRTQHHRSPQQCPEDAPSLALGGSPTAPAPGLAAGLPITPGEDFHSFKSALVNFLLLLNQSFPPINRCPAPAAAFKGSAGD